MIGHEYIQTLLGRMVTDTERAMLALPARLGGSGLENPVTSSSHKYKDSSLLAKSLADLIAKQNLHPLPHPGEQAEIKPYLLFTSNFLFLE